ncbi:MAG TPA: hypothetical protein VFR24_21785 [Candidatus Angelobacter sp.]|nr:hypothetical protein [Candidatus Angelobacter sp.]
MKSLIDGLTLAGAVLQGALALVLLGRKAWKRYPLFTCYAIFGFAVSMMFFFLQRRPTIFFYGYWIQEAITISLGFAVVYEIFKNLFSTHEALLKLAGLIFRWTATALLCLGVAVILVQSPGTIHLGKAVLVLEEATRVVEVGLLMFLFGASAAFGLHWKQAEFGIALGLGLYVAVQLATVALRSQIGVQAWQVMNVVSILAFDSSLLVWLGYLLAPERVTSAGEVPKRAQLEQWNQAVMELISR